MQTLTKKISYPFQTDLIVVQPTPFCNLACKYCYLTEKDLSVRMKMDVLEKTVREVLASGLLHERATMVWHAGEPLALPLGYYSEAFALVDNLDTEKLITHSIQTNGTTINEKWCDLFLAHNVSVGVSIDGPKNIHDANRIDRHGRGSFDKALRGLRYLQAAGIKHHVIAVLTRESIMRPEEVMNFFVGLGIERIGFNIEEIEGEHAISSVAGHESSVENFFRVAHEFHLDRSNRLVVREFEHAYNAIVTAQHPSGDEFVNLNNQVRPFGIITIDYRGNVSTFSPELLGQASHQFSDFLFGDIKKGLRSVINNPAFTSTFAAVQEGVKVCASQCEYFAYCGGGAPSNKFFELGRLEAGETMFCRTHIKLPFSIALRALEEALNITTDVYSSQAVASAQSLTV